MISQQMLSLAQINLADSPTVGAKAATLGWLLQNGLPVASGFVIPTSVFVEFVEKTGLTDRILGVEQLARAPTEDPSLRSDVALIQAALRPGPREPRLRDAVREAFLALEGDPFPVVVRSSAIGEDLPGASFAGQHATVLNVRSYEELWLAIGQVWASLFSESAIHYRARQSPDVNLPAIALIVQKQIASDVSGVLFTIDPVTGRDEVVVEGSWGLGEAIAQGEVVPDRFYLDRDCSRFCQPPIIGDKGWQRVLDPRAGTRLIPVPSGQRRAPILDADQLATLTLLGLKIEELAGGPRDVEWGWAGGRWWIFQARPITSRLEDRPIRQAPSDAIEWTSGFLDERLVEPVSPLGWSVLRTGIEDLAFREPLRMIGIDPLELEPLTRLWNGHPYARVAAFESLYKLFPDWILPEDARRFFPNGDVDRRRHALRPRSLFAPEVWGAVLLAFGRDPVSVSPWHNAAAWDRFQRAYRRTIADLALRVDRLDRALSVDLPSVLALVDAVERPNRRLLAIHRWSLTLAEVSYSLLRRLSRMMLGEKAASTYCASVVESLGDESMKMNQAFAELGRLRREGRQEEFDRRFSDFLAEYGHRSFSLDLIRPSFADEPGQILALLGEPEPEDRDAVAAKLPESVGTVVGNRVGLVSGHSSVASTSSIGSAKDERRVSRWATRLLTPLADLTRRYSRLREDQRFAWQMGLAQLRRLYLVAGRELVRRGQLDELSDVFFLTVDEVRGAASGWVPPLGPRARLRARRFADDRASFAKNASASYPPFLAGDVPLGASADDRKSPVARRAVDERRGAGSSGGDTVLWGEPVSSGIGRGRARVVLAPEDLSALRSGEVLVARGADPGWTAVFDRLAAIVSESGGQLSHASVVAREYRLPAVVAVRDATEIIRTGDDVIVDGGSGQVTRLPRRT